MSSQDERAVAASWATTTAAVRTLGDRVVVRVSGDDARTWLNGQVTNDVRATKAGDAVYALVLSVKGRILADVSVLDRGERGLAFVAPRAVLASLLEHLEHYVIMEDVTVAPDEELAVVTVQGPRAAEVAEGLEAYASDWLGSGGVDVLVPQSELDATFAALTTKARAVGGGAIDDATWELARLRVGRPAMSADFGETTYPQEVGLKDRAVSFSKGCYLGQEVVCMLENRGQLSRRLVRVKSAGALEVGAKLVDAAGAEVGSVTSAARDPETGDVLGLAIVKRAAGEGGAELRAGASAVSILSLA